MPYRSSERYVAGILCALAIVLRAAAAGAQTHDEARLTVGVAMGYIKGTDLWTINQQPIIDLDQTTDLLNLHRRLTSNLSLSAQMAYYRSAHFGFTAEFTYIGLGTEDNCDLAAGGGGIPGGPACTALKGVNRPASAVAVMGGMLWRPASRTAYQPYVRGLLGAAVVPRSTLEVASVFGAQDENRLEIYAAETNSHMIRPSVTVGLGIATASSAGYQLSVEVRESWIVIPIVTGTTTYQGLVPPSANRLKTFPSVLVGLNIVLEQRRGRRY
jgi:hypothetical protein